MTFLAKALPAYFLACLFWSIRSRAKADNSPDLRLATNLRHARMNSRCLRMLAGRVREARLKNGARVLDASDFRQWLLELADTVEEIQAVRPSEPQRRGA